jgi:hypothetical protein
LEILPDHALRELGDDDSAPWVVVRGNDEITIDLMTEACGVRYEDAAGGIETEEIEGVRRRPTDAQNEANPREKDVVDRNFLQQLIRNS